MKKKSYSIALGGILSATALALMFLGSFIPFGTFAVPAAASLIIAIVCEEHSPSLAAGVWVTVGLLAVLLAADKEAAWLFIGFFGHYPMVKLFAEKKLPKFLAFLVKTLCFMFCIGGSYWVMLNLFVVETVREEFAAYSTPMAALLMGLGLLVFLMLDVVLSRCIIIWRRSIRPKYFGK